MSWISGESATRDYLQPPSLPTPTLQQWFREVKASLSVKALAPISHITVDRVVSTLPEDFPTVYFASLLHPHRQQSPSDATGGDGQKAGLKVAAEVEEAWGTFHRGCFHGRLSVRLSGREKGAVKLWLEPHRDLSNKKVHSRISVVEEKEEGEDSRVPSRGGMDFGVRGLHSL